MLERDLKSKVFIETDNDLDQLAILHMITGWWAWYLYINLGESVVLKEHA
jgi:hypothetical protein